MIKYTYNFVYDNSKESCEKTKDDDAFNVFLSKCNYNLDLSNLKHIDELINWLRKWGCRSLSIGSNKTTKESIRTWYNSNKKIINTFKEDLHAIDLNNYKKDIIYIYYELSNSIAAHRKTFPIFFNDVATSKILFAINPRFFVPWDRDIINMFISEHKIRNYYEYLYFVQEKVIELKKDCKKNNIKFDKLFDIFKTDGFERRHESYAKLIEEVIYKNK